MNCQTQEIRPTNDANGKHFHPTSFVSVERHVCEETYRTKREQFKSILRQIHYTTEVRTYRADAAVLLYT